MGKVKTPPRVLIEDWLPAAAIGVECMRERGSASALAPTTFLHVWWARRPLVASRAAVLGSLLPADFPRDVFVRLLGFGQCQVDWESLGSQGAPHHVVTSLKHAMATDDRARQRVFIRQLMDMGIQCGGFGSDRAFKGEVAEEDLDLLSKSIMQLWDGEPHVLDPMAGGGSIPLESARMGFDTLANEYNPVACSVLEATVDYPFRLGPNLAAKAREWGRVLHERFVGRVGEFFPKTIGGRRHRPDGYIFARAVPCPDTGHLTPLVPDWHLSKPKGSEKRIVAEPVADEKKGTWTVRIREVGRGAGQLREPPKPTYADGKGISLFMDRQIPGDYIKAMAQQGKMESVLYAVVIKTSHGLKYEPPMPEDLKALKEAENELARLRPDWEKRNIIPTEEYPEVSSDERPRLYGMPRWADMFAPRQLLCMGVLVEELQKLRREIVKAEGEELGEAVVHLLAFGLDKFVNCNCSSTRWHSSHEVIAGKMDRHDFAFKPAFAEMAACNAGMGLAWAIENPIEAYEDIAKLCRAENAQPAGISLGSATNLPQIADESITAVVVDPPYADNVQYSELADFFYVWLKRTQGHRRPEWFSTYLCDHDQEAVVNVSRFKDGGKVKDARAKANAFYQKMMSDTFKECRRVLRDDGVLTVMFTHKKQSAWEALFTSLIEAGFTISATWPIKTESEHSLHQARKNAAQSTVILVARKRLEDAGTGYFDSTMKREIRHAARNAAARLQAEGLNPVDQLVGSFGPAMEVYSQYDEVKTDTGMPVGVDKAIDEASDAVSQWRIEQLAERGLEGVEPEGRFYLLCWDVLGAQEFRFNEASLLGKAVGMDVDQLVVAGLVTKSGDKIQILSAKDRRRSRALEPDEIAETMFGPEIVKKKRHTKKDVLKVHPNDPQFRTSLDGCHALALRFVEAAGESAGIGSAKSLAHQQRWGKESSVAKLMAALVKAAPEAVRFDKGKTSAGARFPEFRAWHALLKPLFEIEPEKWKEKPTEKTLLSGIPDEADEEQGEGEEKESEA